MKTKILLFALFMLSLQGISQVVIKCNHVKKFIPDGTTTKIVYENSIILTITINEEKSLLTEKTFQGDEKYFIDKTKTKISKNTKNSLFNDYSFWTIDVNGDDCMYFICPSENIISKALIKNDFTATFTDYTIEKTYGDF